MATPVNSSNDVTTTAPVGDNPNARNNCDFGKIIQVVCFHDEGARQERKKLMTLVKAAGCPIVFVNMHRAEFAYTLKPGEKDLLNELPNDPNRRKLAKNFASPDINESAMDLPVPHNA